MARLKLTADEIERAVSDPYWRERFPPIMTTNQVAAMLQYPPKTIYLYVQQGKFEGAFRRRGKPMRFWRDRVIKIFFDGPEWPEKHEDSNEKK